MANEANYDILMANEAALDFKLLLGRQLLGFECCDGFADFVIFHGNVAFFAICSQVFLKMNETMSFTRSRRLEQVMGL